MNDTAIIFGTYNRAHLLSRSLQKYPSNVDIYVLDDGSTDNTLAYVWQLRNIDDKKNIFYQYLGNKTGWRDSAAYLNEGIKQALQKGYKYIFITHPEIIPGKTTIESAKSLAIDKETWVSCKGYYLTPEQQELLDCINWQRDLLNVRHLKGFYGQANSAEFRGNKDYLPENIEQCKVWHSWIFGGGSADMWKYFGGVTPFEVWGSIDVDLLNRRHIAGMKTVTPCKDTDIVVHQNHDDLGTPRDMNLCMASLPKYTSKQEALKPELLL